MVVAVAGERARAGSLARVEAAACVGAQVQVGPFGACQRSAGATSGHRCPGRAETGCSGFSSREMLGSPTSIPAQLQCQVLAAPAEQRRRFGVRTGARAGWSPAPLACSPVPPAPPARRADRRCGRCDGLRSGPLGCASRGLPWSGCSGRTCRCRPRSRSGRRRGPGWCGRRARSAPRTTRWCTRRHAAPASGAAGHRTAAGGSPSRPGPDRPGWCTTGAPTPGRHARLARPPAVVPSTLLSPSELGPVESFTQPGPGDRGRDTAVAGDPGRFEHRPVRVTAAEQGPVGHHQVHLHRLQLTRSPARTATAARCPPRPHPPPDPAGPPRRTARTPRPGSGPAPPRTPRPRP